MEFVHSSLHQNLICAHCTRVSTDMIRNFDEHFIGSHPGRFPLTHAFAFFLFCFVKGNERKKINIHKLAVNNVQK